MIRTNQRSHNNVRKTIQKLRIFIAMEEQTFKDLLDFVYAKTLLSKNVALGPNSRLCDDVGLTGWDAHEFFMAYAERFQVDVKSFQLADYVGAEGSMFHFLPKTVLTIHHLFLGIQHSKLDDQIINGVNLS
jgi:hypothetical protein